MKLFVNFIAFLLLTNQVYSDDFEDFKALVLDEIKTLKEDNAKKGQEIASLKSGREEVITAIQNNEVKTDGLEALENRIEENHNKLNKKLENLEKKFDANISSIIQSYNYQTQELSKLAMDINAHGEQLKSLTVNEVGQNEKFDQDINCPSDDNLYRKINGKCYYFVNQKKVHNNAKNFCKTRIVMGKMGKLTEPETRAINKLIFDEAKNVYGKVESYHIGVEKTSAEKWVFSSSKQFISTSIWEKSQPNKDGNCVYVSHFGNEKWYDGACSDAKFSVCEFSINNSLYKSTDIWH